MNQITDMILIALFIEAVVNAIKPVWTPGGDKLTVTEYVSMAMGILLAVTCKINLLAFVVEMTYPVWVEYIFFVMTGIAIGRGTNFLYDLWSKVKEWKNGKLLTEEIVEEVKVAGEEFDVEITHWPLEMIIAFANENGFALPESMPTDEQAAKKYLIDYMFPYEDEHNDTVEDEKQPPDEAGDVW